MFFQTSRRQCHCTHRIKSKGNKTYNLRSPSVGKVWESWTLEKKGNARLSLDQTYVWFETYASDVWLDVLGLLGSLNSAGPGREDWKEQTTDAVTNPCLPWQVLLLQEATGTMLECSPTSTWLNFQPYEISYKGGRHIATNATYLLTGKGPKLIWKKLCFRVAEFVSEVEGLECLFRVLHSCFVYCCENYPEIPFSVAFYQCKEMHVYVYS